MEQARKETGTEQGVLQERLELLQAVLDEVGAYVFMKDLQGRYTFVNRLVQQLFNRPLADILGKDDSEFFDQAGSAQLFEHDRRVMQQGETLETEEVNFIKGSDEPRTYYTVKKPLRNAIGGIVGMCGISTDISEYKQLQEQAREQKELLETVLGHVDAAIYMKDAGSHYRYGNRKTFEHFGLPGEAVIGKRDSELLPPDFAAEIERLDKQVMESGETHYAEESLPDSEGVERHYWSVKVPMLHAGKPPMLIGFSTDITALHQLRVQLHKQSITDDLTGLYNRRFLFETLNKELSRARRQKLDTTLLLIDMDHFKMVNDRFGHPAGDRVLHEFGAMLQRSLRTEDTAARVGGEEFAVLLPDSDYDSAMATAERIRGMTSSLVFHTDAGEPFGVTASIGLVHLANGEGSTDSLYSEADQLLYEAKQGGRNCICSKR